MRRQECASERWRCRSGIQGAGDFRANSCREPTPRASRDASRDACYAASRTATGPEGGHTPTSAAGV
jgi:hypothetical protein